MDNLDTVVVSFLTDGRSEYLSQTVKSWETHSDILKSKNKLIFDDSGDESYREYLRNTYTNYKIVPISENRVKINRAIHFAHQYIKSLNCSHTVWIEDDQILLLDINILNMIEIIEREKLLQLSLVRAPFFYDELGDKNIIDTLTKNGWPMVDMGDYTAHEVIFPLHPHVFPNRILDCKWQQDDDAVFCESKFAKRLFSLFPRTSDKLRLGFYGNKDSDPQNKHIGKYGNNTAKYYWNESEDWYLND